ncbi:MAG: hypothetical protein IJC76_04450 [Lachnospiraceae bacterium]|nr:hypothetical protein [Lachnospiraceae bacterium]
MYFLIDYENVNYAGLEGTEFLEKGDTVSFFYSDKCEKIINYRMKEIEKSECNFEICKLKNTRKNGLDFYIASKVGEIFALNPDEKVAIISGDNGFQAVIDYWRPRLAVQNQLVKCKTIAKAIICINGEGVRKSLVNESLAIVDLETKFAVYEERKRIVEVVTSVFTGTEQEPFIEQIVDMVMLSDKPRILYLTSLKSFGKKNGTEVYRKVKGAKVGV